MTDAFVPLPALDQLGWVDCTEALSPLFERGAERFLSKLAVLRPFFEPETLFIRARDLAHRLPEDEQVELVNAHPRLGAPPGSVSPLSFREQGYDAESADEAAEAERRRLDHELRRLNEAYERRFGFRYCVFVAGRPRAALLSELEVALAADRAAELSRALDAVVDIAADRYAKLTG
jgi:2-oxo-4-hydroxy-4-carboxy-5-ureidoimidazoline decarboxylase